MNSDRGWYLVAVGVLALGLSNSVSSDSARGFSDRAAAQTICPPRRCGDSPSPS